MDGLAILDKLRLVGEVYAKIDLAVICVHDSSG